KAAPKDDGINIEDLNLPKSIVQRLAKGVLPPNTQIQKDALLAMSKSATVFVNYLTSCAAENAARSNKKTVMPKDVFDAMAELEFEAFLPRLEAEV
ncbi:histone-fold-containing protein, partial [Corynespora cassiicola Philippines]